MAQAKRDQNDVPTLLGVSNVDGATPVTIYADPTTHRLLVDLPAGNGITSINADGTAAQTLTVGTTGTDFAIVDDAAGDHKFNLPTASGTNRGALSSADWTTFNNKGTVTSVSVTTVNGVSGSVANATTTPAISLTLGAITPTSVAVSGTAGAGFQTFVGQSANPTAPAAGTLLVHSATVNGFTRLEQDNEAATNVVYARDSVFIGKNTSGGNFTKGQVVYVTGSTGNVPNLALARANAASTIPTIGVCLDAILDNAFGQIMLIGVISNIDTSAFTTGDLLYLSTSVAGGVQNTRPSGTSGAYVQRIGSVLVSGVGNGSILVDIAPFIGNVETGTVAATWTGNAVVATTYNGNTFTTGTGTLTIAASKTLTANNSITLAGTDSTVMTFPSTSQTVVGLTSTQTLTNKRVTRRLVTANAPGATPTTNTDNVDIQNFTGLAAAITSMSTNLSGTPVDGDKVEFRFTDDGTGRAITWGASFGATTVALPTTTVASTMLRVGFEYNGSIWQCIAVA